MADAQGNPSSPSSSSSASSTLSVVEDCIDDKDYTNPEIGKEFFNREEQEGEEAGEEIEEEEDEDEDEDENENEVEEEEYEDEDEDEENEFEVEDEEDEFEEEEDEFENEDEDEDEDEEDDEDDEEEEEEEDEEEEARLNSAAVRADNPFQVSNCPRVIYSRQEEIRRILRGLRGEPDENQNKRCTRCKAMGHVCLDCPLPIRFIPRNERPEYVPQQSPMQPNEAHSPGQGPATNPSKAGCAGSSSQEVDPQTVVPSVSSATASASQLGKRKSDLESEKGSPAKKP